MRPTAEPRSDEGAETGLAAVSEVCSQIDLLEAVEVMADIDEGLAAVERLDDGGVRLAAAEIAERAVEPTLGQELELLAALGHRHRSAPGHSLQTFPFLSSPQETEARRRRSRPPHIPNHQMGWKQNRVPPPH